MSGRVRVLLVEDQALIRTLLAETLTASGYAVTAAASAAEAMSLVDGVDPHVIMSDLDLGGPATGVDLLARIGEDRPWVAAVAVSAHSSAEMAVGEQLPPGIAYLRKSDIDGQEALRAAIDSALRSTPLAPPPHEPGRPAVTRAQAALLRGLAAGRSVAAIARERGSSTRAVEVMLQRLYGNLAIPSGPDVDRRTQAVLLWQRGGIDVR